MVAKGGIVGKARQLTSGVPLDHEKLCAWWMDGREHILRRGGDLGKGRFLPAGAASPALHPQLSPAPPCTTGPALHCLRLTKTVAMRQKLNFIIALPYLMSVSQAAGDVLMKLELYSL